MSPGPIVKPVGGEVGGDDEIDDRGEQGGDCEEWWIGEEGSGVSVTRISGLGDLGGGGLVGTTSTTCDSRCTFMLKIFNLTQTSKVFYSFIQSLKLIMSLV